MRRRLGGRNETLTQKLMCHVLSIPLFCMSVQPLPLHEEQSAAHALDALPYSWAGLPTGAAVNGREGSLDRGTGIGKEPPSLDCNCHSQFEQMQSVKLSYDFLGLDMENSESGISRASSSLCDSRWSLLLLHQSMEAKQVPHPPHAQARIASGRSSPRVVAYIHTPS